VRVYNRTRGAVIATEVEVATSLWARTRGLIGRRALPAGFGLVIRPCLAIHTAMVAVELDVVHVDRAGCVVRILHRIKPWRLGPIVWRSAWVVELPAGTARARGIEVGDVVELAAERRDP
jgi:uncharacterized membrane protein (UPF0127 family)